MRGWFERLPHHSAAGEAAVVAPRIVGRRALGVGAADAFDTTLMLLPLHHCDRPDAVLDEALRVTPHRLVATESVWRTAAERFWLMPSTAASTAPGTAAA